MQYSFFFRGQYPKGEDMVARFADLAAEVQRSSPTTKIVYMTGYSE